MRCLAISAFLVAIAMSGKCSQICQIQIYNKTVEFADWFSALKCTLQERKRAGTCLCGKGVDNFRKVFHNVVPEYNY